MNDPAILITGATGFLARHLLHALNSRRPGVPTLALVRDPQSWHQQDWTGLLPEVGIIQGAVTDTAWTTDQRLTGLGGIFHLAGLVRHSRHHRPEEVYQTNIEGTLNMVRLAAAQNCRLVMVSTSGAVGCFDNPGQQADENAPYCLDTVSRWPYYQSKIKAEQQARELAGKLGVDLVIIRPPVLLGPGDHRFRSTGHIVKYLRRRLPFLIDGGMHFVDVRDVATATVTAMTLPRARPIYHICGTACSIEDFFQLVHQASGVPAPRWFLPYRIAHVISILTRRLGLFPDPVVVEMASHYWGLSSLYAATELGFTARPGTETIADTVAWLYEHHPALAQAKLAGPAGQTQPPKTGADGRPERDCQGLPTTEK